MNLPDSRLELCGDCSPDCSVRSVCHFLELEGKNTFEVSELLEDAFLNKSDTVTQDILVAKLRTKDLAQTILRSALARVDQLMCVEDTEPSG